MENWYLACHKAGKHNAFKAQMFLAKLNATAFIPQIYILKSRADRIGQYKKSLEPLFPGYIFIYFDPEIVHTSKISSCPGISHLVRFCNSILPVHDHVVDQIMQLPICASSSLAPVHNKEIKNKSNFHFTKEQQANLYQVIEEKDGVTRSALFYEFAKKITGRRF